MKVSPKSVPSTVGNFAHIVLTDLDAEEEKAMRTEIKEKFKPLLSWLKVQAEGIVRDGLRRVDISCSLADLLSSRYLRSPGGQPVRHCSRRNRLHC